MMNDCELIAAEAVMLLMNRVTSDTGISQTVVYKNSKYLLKIEGEFDLKISRFSEDGHSVLPMMLLHDWLNHFARSISIIAELIRIDSIETL